MTTDNTTTKERDNRALAVTGFGLLLIGLFIPFLCAALRLPDALLYASCAALILALIFGIVAWPRRLAKVTTIGAGLLCLLAIVQFFLFFTAGSRLEREMKAKMEQRP
jgi:hypothetical protein